jgi:hypothetical protein
LDERFLLRRAPLDDSLLPSGELVLRLFHEEPDLTRYMISGPVDKASSANAGSHSFSSITLSKSVVRLPPSSFTFTDVFFFYFQLIFQSIGLSSFYLACGPSSLHASKPLAHSHLRSRRFFFLCSSATSSTANDPFGGYGSEVISVANSVYIATLGVTS